MSGYLLSPVRVGPRAAGLPAIAGSCSGPAIVCGSARCLWDDLAAAPAGDLVAVNYAGIFLHDTPKHWVSIHAEAFQWMLPLRVGRVWQGDGRLQAGQGIETHAQHQCIGVRHVWPAKRDGSSGLFAARVALALGYAPVILCGIPLDRGGHFYDQPGKSTGEGNYGLYLDSWRGAAKYEFGGRVFSMSGATRNLLGAPC